MATRTSIHGRALGFDKTHLYLHGRPVGSALVGRGKTFYVDSAIDGTGGENPDEAVGTLDEAFALCTANRGDIIVVMPNHAETITGAAGIAHDVAGVSVVGLGVGSQRPRFLMDGGTSVTYAISAADAYVGNLVFASGHADVVTCFNVTASGAWIDACEFEDNTADENFVTEIKATSTTDNNADDLKVTNCRAMTPDASGAEFIEIAADLDGLVATGNFVCKDAGTAAGFIVCATGKDLTNCRIESNRLVSGATSGDIFINNDTAANSGIVAFNLVGHHDADAAAPFDVDGVRFFENYAVGVDTGSALLLPAVDDNS